ncbi:MAG: hypothetical protein KKG59_00270 [Nanoarchaeota archaeon]|nr:hypothetical protein [Nanoarchaeota archaeon]
MKKGQIKQVFVYGMTIVLIGFVLLIGVSSLVRVDDSKCQAEKITFFRQLNTMLKANVVFGREQQADIVKPCTYQAVCFVDARRVEAVQGTTDLAEFTNLKTGAPAYTLADPDKENIIITSVKNNVEMNVFLITEKIVEPVGFNEKIQLKPDSRYTLGVGGDNFPNYAFCIPARAGKFEFSLEGTGRSVLIS